jgi:hypothetical protein
MIYYKDIEAIGLVFEMMSSLEICFLYCIAFVGVVAHSLRLWTASLLAGESMDKFEPTMTSSCRPVIGFTSIEASAYCAENLGVLALYLCLDKLIIDRFSRFSHLTKSQFYSPTSVLNVSVTKLFEL